MEVDTAHGLVFVTAAPTGSSSVLVFDYRGRLVTSIENQPGAAGMALDGNQLHVALWGAAAISTIDTVTLSEVARRPLEPYLACPNTLVQSGTRLWFGYTCEFDNGGVGYLDLMSGESGPLEPNGSFYDPLVAVSNSGILITADRGLSPVTLYEYDVSETPRLLRWEFNPGGGTSDLVDLDITADGEHLLVSALTPSQYVQSFALSDLQLDGTYIEPEYPNGANVAPDGMVVIAGHLSYDPALFFYLPGSTTSFFTNVVDDFALDRAEVLSPDLLWVFEVHGVFGGSEFGVQLGPANSFLDMVADPNRVPLGRPVDFTGQLTFPLGPSPDDQLIRLFRANPDRTQTHLGDVLTDPSGGFAFTDTAPTGGRFRYSVMFSGDGEQPKARASSSVTVYEPSWRT
jgi:hypothetical protein